MKKWIVSLVIVAALWAVTWYILRPSQNAASLTGDGADASLRDKTANRKADAWWRKALEPSTPPLAQPASPDVEISDAEKRFLRLLRSKSESGALTSKDTVDLLRGPETSDHKAAILQAFLASTRSIDDLAPREQWISALVALLINESTTGELPFTAGRLLHLISSSDSERTVTSRLSDRASRARIAPDRRLGLVAAARDLDLLRDVATHDDESIRVRREALANLARQNDAKVMNALLDEAAAPLELRLIALAEALRLAESPLDLQKGVMRIGALARESRAQSDMALIDRAWSAAAKSNVRGKAEFLMGSWQSALKILQDDSSTLAHSTLGIMGRAAAEAFWTDADQYSRAQAKAALDETMVELTAASIAAVGGHQASRRRAITALAESVVDACRELGASCTEKPEGREYVEVLLGRLKN